MTRQKDGFQGNERVYKWDHRFLLLAREVATWSKDPSTKVGAVLVDPDRHVVSTGYNGFPPRIMDDPALLDDREQRLLHTVHAEMNAILQARRDLRGCNLYVSIPFICTECAKHICACGISKVVLPEGEVPERWQANHFAAVGMLLKSEVLIGLDRG